MVLPLMENQLKGQVISSTQTIRGILTDKVTGQPLQSAKINVTSINPTLSTQTNAEGEFRLEKVPTGRHQLTITLPRYEFYSIPDLVVHSGKETILEIALNETLYEADEVEISATSNRNIETVSTRLITVEETKRFAAVYFDPARMATSFPGVAAANDQANHLIIRGNSPNGVLWRMEGVDIVNPNHLTNAGTLTDRITQSGGGTIMISTQLMANSQFLTGAFTPEYGNSLAGVFDMNLRKGNNEHHEFTLQAGLIGVDLAAEGPLRKGYNGSFLVNYRYSTVGLLSLMGVPLGDEEINYQDLSFNLSLPTEKMGTFTLFGIGGLSKNIFQGAREDSLRKESKDRFDIDFKSNMGAVGMTHQLLVGERTLWRTVVAASTIAGSRQGRFLDDQFAPTLVQEDKLNQTKIASTTSISHKINSKLTLKSGVFFTQIYDDLSKAKAPLESNAELVTTASGKGGSQLVQPYVNFNFRPSPRIQIQAGLHSMWYSLSDSWALEPRASIQYKASSKTQIRFAYGLHSQTQLPGIYYAAFEDNNGNQTFPNQTLDFTRSNHLVLGLDHQLGKQLSLKIEPYYQLLNRVPISPNNAIGNNFSAINLLEGFPDEPLINEGQGLNYGIDVSLEKLLSNEYYFLLSGSLYEAKYKTYGDWLDARFNGNYLLSASGGWERDRVTKKGKNKSFGINLRVIYQGGYRDMPIDIAASTLAQETIYETSQGFSEKLPNYFRTDLRILFKRHRKKYTRSFGFDIQNLTNSQNLAFRTFDIVKNEVVSKFQLGIIPLLSYRLEFY